MAIKGTHNGSSRQRKERFLELLEPVHDNLARFARSMTGGEEDARDLVGETVLRALENFDELRDEQAFLAWLFTIAARLQRRRARRAQLFGPYEEREIVRRPAPGSSPETAHDISALYSALDRLGAKERETIVLFEIAGLSLEEVREVQGGSLSGVKSRLVRGRRKLARLLGEDRESREGSGTVSAAPKGTTYRSTTGSEPFIYAAAQNND